MGVPNCLEEKLAPNPGSRPLRSVWEARARPRHREGGEKKAPQAVGKKGPGVRWWLNSLEQKKKRGDKKRKKKIPQQRRGGKPSEKKSVAIIRGKRGGRTEC